jgi:hypothetical protein
MRIVALVATLVLALLSGCGPIRTLDELIMRPRHKIRTTPADFGYTYDEIHVPVTGERSVVIWHVHAADPKALMVVIPGSSSNKGSYAKALWLFIDDNYDVILMDYESYGSSPGEPTLQHAADDAQAVTEYAQRVSDKVVLFGASLGSPLAARAGAQYDVAGVILEGSLILGQEPLLWLQHQSVLWSGLGLITDLVIAPQVPKDFDILKYIRMVQAPKLIMHSIEDEVTPYAAGVKVYDAAGPPKEFWQMRHKHGQMVKKESIEYAARVRGWLDATLGFGTPTSQPVTTQPSIGS